MKNPVIVIAGVMLLLFAAFVIWNYINAPQFRPNEGFENGSAHEQ